MSKYIVEVECHCYSSATTAYEVDVQGEEAARSLYKYGKIVGEKEGFSSKLEQVSKVTKMEEEDT